MISRPSWALAALLLAAPATVGAQRVGEPAPSFTNAGTDGKTYRLADFKGRYVVLEWHNPGCPFTQKHYASGNLPRLQKEWRAKGVVWFTVVAPAVPTENVDAYLKSKGGTPTAVLLDGSGATARAFRARTTPQMIVINPSGVVIYNGAIDDTPTADIADLATAKNYVAAALTDAMAGRPVATPASRPYGCAVTYPGSE